VDLLGYIRQKSGDAEYSNRKNTLEVERRHATTMLLGRLSASLLNYIFMKDKIIFSETLSGLTPKKLEGFFVGWPKKPSSKTLLTLLKKSDYRITARNSSGHVVGFITAISDGTLAAYIPFLEVLPEYQGKKIGTQLTKRMLKKLKHLYMVDLLCDTSVQPYYAKFGMKNATGMMLRNYKQQAGNK